MQRYLIRLVCSAAANAAGIPSVLITNFTFDSVYSYLSTLIVDETDVHDSLSAHALAHTSLTPDVPLRRGEVGPLVRQLWGGYRCADLLLRLPGAIPIPSFAVHPAMPSPDWVDVQTRRFMSAIFDHLSEDTSQYTLLQQVPFPPQYPPKMVPRTVISAPLIVRSPSSVVYTEEGRHRLLDSIGVPRHLQDNPTTKILIVSFGGQVFHKPSHSRSSSLAQTPNVSILEPSKQMNGVRHVHHSCAPAAAVLSIKKSMPTDAKDANAGIEALASALQNNLHAPRRTGSLRVRVDCKSSTSLLMIPGAPAASLPSSPATVTIPTFPSVVPPTPEIEQVEDRFGHVSVSEEEYKDDVFGTLLPDESWLAIVCGVPKEWAAAGGEALPDNFFVAPKDVYMPDLTAVADVLLGKLVCLPIATANMGLWLIGDLCRAMAPCRSASMPARRSCTSHARSSSRSMASACSSSVAALVSSSRGWRMNRAGGQPRSGRRTSRVETGRRGRERRARRGSARRREGRWRRCWFSGLGDGKKWRCRLDKRQTWTLGLMHEPTAATPHMYTRQCCITRCGELNSRPKCSLQQYAAVPHGTILRLLLHERPPLLASHPSHNLLRASDTKDLVLAAHTRAIHESFRGLLNVRPALLVLGGLFERLDTQREAHALQEGRLRDRAMGCC